MNMNDDNGEDTVYGNGVGLILLMLSTADAKDDDAAQCISKRVCLQNSH